MSKTKLPIGIQTFSEIRDENYYYVDKTAYAKRLIDEAKHNFLSRPRRFGKSLFVDTLKNLFEGKKQLFEGLYIHDKWNWDVKYPVLRFSFGKGDFQQPGELQKNVLEQLTDFEDGAGVKPKHETAAGRFAYLLKELVKEKGQRVVILVDEYDEPDLSTDVADRRRQAATGSADALDKKELAEANRSTLSGFYSTIKDCEEYIRFSFLTGVTKFAHAVTYQQSWAGGAGRRRSTLSAAVSAARISAGRNGQPRQLINQAPSVGKSGAQQPDRHHAETGVFLDLRLHGPRPRHRVRAGARKTQRIRKD